MKSVEISNSWHASNERLSVSIFYEKRKLGRLYSYERGIEEHDDIIVVHITDGASSGIGECSPFPSFFNKPVEAAINELHQVMPLILSGLNNRALIELMPAGPARNAVDAALLDLTCKTKGVDIWHLLNLSPPSPITTSLTIEYESLHNITDRLEALSSSPVIKLKLGSRGDDVQRIQLARKICSSSQIIVDVNEGWQYNYLIEMMPFLIKFDVQMIEQPLSRLCDEQLMDYRSPIPIYADESFQNEWDLDRILKCYDGVNIKLDKVGGLTKAMDIIQSAKEHEGGIMVGCLGGTSLSSSAGFVAAQHASFVDLDNHLWLMQDREPSFGGHDGIIEGYLNKGWGYP